MSTIVRPDVRRGRRHAIRADGQPLCGGGHGAADADFQNDFGDDINCKSCLAIQQRKQTTMTKQRIKLKLPDIASRHEAEAVMNELAGAVNEQRALVAERDAQVLAISKKYEAALADLDQVVKTRTDSLHAWASTNPQEFPKDRKSLDLSAGTLGFRTGTPKLGLASRLWTWDKVIAALKAIKATGWLRTKEEVDKEAVLAMHSQGNVFDADLTNIGLKVTQEESFYIEPALTETTDRQTVTEATK